MRKRNVSARIRQKVARMPCRDELKVLEILASAQACERLADSWSGRTDAVCYVDYAGQFLELVEQRLRYRHVAAFVRVWEERDLDSEGARDEDRQSETHVWAQSTF